jgi:hypothetical protein
MATCKTATTENKPAARGQLGSRVVNTRLLFSEIATVPERERYDGFLGQEALASAAIPGDGISPSEVGDPRLPVIQRQVLAQRIGHAQGNRELQRVIAAGYHHDHEQIGPVWIRRQEDAEQEPVEPVPDVAAEGAPHETVVYAGERTIRIHGRTRARFNGGSFRTVNVVTEPGVGCEGCRARNCVHVTGSVVIDYHVTTSVTLPPIPRGLTPCQRERVQEAIDNVIAPHEAEHVAAFEQYNGTTEQPFDLTLCRNRFPAAIRSMVRQEETPRRAEAQAASDALDPFETEVDLNCEES